MAYRAKTGFRLVSRRVVHAGDLISSSDPDAEQMLDAGLIETVDGYLSGRVESATANPGETRDVSPPKKKPAAKRGK